MISKKPGVILTMICAVILVGVANYSHAQYSGPDSSSASSKDRIKQALGMESNASKSTLTIGELKKDPVYDRDITVKGKLVKKTGSKAYRFEDGTGNMTVTIEDSLFNNRNVSDSTTVEITGRLQKSVKSLLKGMEFKATGLKAVQD